MASHAPAAREKHTLTPLSGGRLLMFGGAGRAALWAGRGACSVHAPVGVVHGAHAPVCMRRFECCMAGRQLSAE